MPSLPREIPEVPAPQTVASETAGHIGRRILVVDDIADSAASLAELLALWGHEVRAVHNGAAAIETVRAWRAEIVLLDIGMPGMDGYEVARRLRAEHGRNGLTLVALTGFGQETDREAAREAGFDHHLVKPVALDVLRGLLAQIIA
jgi:CheY-like chemotaxis protein